MFQSSIIPGGSGPMHILAKARAGRTLRASDITLVISGHAHGVRCPASSVARPVPRQRLTDPLHGLQNATVPRVAPPSALG